MKAAPSLEDGPGLESEDGNEEVPKGALPRGRSYFRGKGSNWTGTARNGWV